MEKLLQPRNEDGATPDVLIMTSLHRWDDPRIFHKQACSLAARYRVELHCPLEKRQSFTRKGIKIIPLPVYSRRYLRPLNWLRLLWRGIRSPARVIHFHDPELLPAGCLIKLLAKKKLVYDVHEDFPASIENKAWIPARFRRALAALLGRAEKWMSRRANALVLAEQYYHELFTGPPALKVGIYNYPVLNMFPGPASPGKKNDQVFNLVYAGVISKPRGAVEMVLSLSRVHWAGKNFRLFLIGPVRPAELKDELLALAGEHGMAGKLEFTGMIPWEQVCRYYACSDLGLALLHPEKNYTRSMATKIFEYMAAGIPVLASDFPAWARLVSGTGCGLNANPLDEESIARQIEFMLHNPELRQEMSQNGYNAFRRDYNWQQEEKKLLHLYEQLLSKAQVLKNDRL